MLLYALFLPSRLVHWKVGRAQTIHRHFLIIPFAIITILIILPFIAQNFRFWINAVLDTGRGTCSEKWGLN
jgi:hypothetical protein